MDALTTAIIGLCSGLTAAITTIRVLASRDHRRADDLPHEIEKRIDDFKHETRLLLDELKHEFKNVQLPREFWEKLAELRHMIDGVSNDTESMRTRLHDLANSMHEMKVRAEKADSERGKL